MQQLKTKVDDATLRSLMESAGVQSCSDAEWLEAKALTDAAASRVKLPPNWRELRVSESSPLYGSRQYVRRTADIVSAQVMLSADRHEGRAWLHVSMVCDRRVPSYAELCDLKSIFVGDELQALQVFPPKSQHVNIYQYALHLWACLEADGDGLPEFGKHGTI